MILFSVKLPRVSLRLSAAVVAVGSVLATVVCITNAFAINRQFYPSIVYLTKSSASLSVLYVQALVIVYMMFQVLRKIFFGELRAGEIEHMNERGWHALMETCLAFTVFRDDFSPAFVAQFVLLLFAKSFHWLSEERIDMMERSPVITLKFHVRMLGLISILGAVDSYLMSYAYFTTLTKGPSAQVVFGFEYAILMALVVHITIKYMLHMHDLRTAQAWDNKAVYLLYAELFINTLRVLLYVLFASMMMRTQTLPLFFIRPFYLAVRSLYKAANDVILSQRAINAMDNSFPIVRTEELANMDATCIICRELQEMTVEAQPKRLPCSHVFHAHCLRSWFQRQQTCPTCRTDILRNRGAGIQNGNANGQPAQPQAAGVGGGVPMFPFVAHQFAFQQPPHHILRPNVNGNVAAAAGVPVAPAGPAPAGAQAQFQGHFMAALPGADRIFQGNHGAAAGAAPGAGQLPPVFPGFLPGQLPPPFPGAPFALPMGLAPPLPPPPPFMFPAAPTFQGLSDEELQSIESNTRVALEHRIRMLQDISTLLDAAVLQMQQYANVVGPLSARPVPTPFAQSHTAEHQGTQSNNSQEETVNSSTTATSTQANATPTTAENVNPSTSSIETSAEVNESWANETRQRAGQDDATADEIRRRRLQRFGETE